jgi:hypothetical protein
MDIRLYTWGSEEGPQHAGMLPYNAVKPVKGQPYTQQRNIHASTRGMET